MLTSLKIDTEKQEARHNYLLTETGALCAQFISQQLDTKFLVSTSVGKKNAECFFTLEKPTTVTAKPFLNCMRFFLLAHFSFLTQK